MNEGWATFWHYTILQELYKEGIVGDGFMMEFLQSHTNVVYQPATSQYYNGINPYALGFAMMSDIRRICEEPDRRRPRLVPRHRRQRLAQDARLRDAQLQGRELHRPVPVAQADPRLPLLSPCSTTTRTTS
jgi:spore cortex formation protein SpoVR/YcgB (stage V sporulation)